MLISFLIKRERRDTNLESLTLSKTHSKELENSSERDIGRKTLPPIKWFLIIGKIRLLLPIVKNVGLAEKLDILHQSVQKENKKLQK